MNIKKGPWTIIDSKTIYKNPWIKVREDKVIRPDGKNGIFGVVTMKNGVSILPYDNKGNVYLTKEYQYSIERVSIEAISGGIDDKESVLDAAKRELKEEAGLEAKDWIDFSFVDPFTSVVVSPNYLYLARDLSQCQLNQEGTETIKIIKVPFSKALDWVMNGKITHSATVVLILKTAIYLKENKKNKLL